MANNLDRAYQDLLSKILSKGRKKGDRTGTGTIAIAGAEIRHDMREGFPLLTTKKMFLRGIAVELEWFLRGGTNIKYLVDRNVNIWNGDAYKNYLRRGQAEYEVFTNKNPGVLVDYPVLSQDEFVATIKNDTDFAEKFGNLGPVYGHQWRNYGGDFTSADGEFSRVSFVGLDQLAQAVETLKRDPNSRRIKVEAWKADEIKYCALPPCHTGFQFLTCELGLDERIDIYNQRHPDWVLVPEHKFLDQHNIPARGLHLIWSQRSVDTFLGLPFNIASYGLLLEIVAKQVNMVPMELIGHLNDVHIYLNHIKQCEEQVGRESFPPPTISLEDSVTIDNFELSMLKLHNYLSNSKLEGAISN